MLTSVIWQKAAACSHNLFHAPLSLCFLLINYDQPKNIALQLDIAAICCLSKGHSFTEVSGRAEKNGSICRLGEENSLLLNTSKLLDPQSPGAHWTQHPGLWEGSHGSNQLPGESADFSAQVLKTDFGRKAPLG